MKKENLSSPSDFSRINFGKVNVECIQQYVSIIPCGKFPSPPDTTQSIGSPRNWEAVTIREKISKIDAVTLLCSRNIPSDI